MNHNQLIRFNKFVDGLSVSVRYGSKDAFLTLAKVAQTLAIEGLDLSHLKSYRKVVPIPTPLAPAALESSSH